MTARVILVPKVNSHPFDDRVLLLDVPCKIGRAHKDDQVSVLLNLFTFLVIDLVFCDFLMKTFKVKFNYCITKNAFIHIFSGSFRAVENFLY